MAIRVQDILWIRMLQRGSQFPDQFSGYFLGIKLVDHGTLMTTFTDERDLGVVSLVSKDNGFTWSEWATLHDSARDLVGWNGMGTAQGLFKSGIGSPTPGFASIGVDWTAFTFIVGPQPAAGGIFTAEINNHHHWKEGLGRSSYFPVRIGPRAARVSAGRPVAILSECRVIG